MTPEISALHTLIVTWRPVKPRCPYEFTGRNLDSRTAQMVEAEKCCRCGGWTYRYDTVLCKPLCGLCLRDGRIR